MRARRATWPAVFALASLALGCEHYKPPGPAKDPPEPPASADSIPVGPVSGKLLDQPFTELSGRYFVDQRPGFEKMDIKLYATEAETPCGKLKEEKPASVWLRRAGAERATPGSSVTNLDKGEWEVHYQVQKDGFWVGNGDARALVVISDVGPDLKISGALSACFRDETGSCVAGSFTASYCRISIDSPVRGTEAMERPPERKLPPIPAPASAAPSSSDAPPAEAPKEKAP
jgi:hypothetical protein